MKKLLIAENSHIFTEALVSALKDSFQIRSCNDGNVALQLLEEFRPDVLIFNLMLPYLDGVTMLKASAFQPRIILAVTPFVNGYVQRCIVELGIDYTMITPSVNALVMRLQDLLRADETLPEQRDLQTMTQHHLKRLGFSVHLDGYRQLCLALPMFALDPQQRLTKELYPKIASLCGSPDGRTAEHSIRKAIHDAWCRRDAAVWRKYFPGSFRTCPTNKEFLCRLSELLNTEERMS